MSAKDHGWPPDVAQTVGRMCFRSDGKRKRRLTAEQAKRNAIRIGAQAYACPRCGRWHVGSIKA